MSTRRCFLVLDLKNDAALIDEYEWHHREVWPEVKDSIAASGIQHMEIHRWENRLVMMIEVEEGFTFDKKQRMDQSNHNVQEWEQLMSKFQQSLPGTREGSKWQVMDKIFELS